MTTLTFEEKLGFIKKNIEERVSRVGGAPEQLYEDIVSFFTTCELDPKKRERIEENFRKGDFKRGFFVSIDKIIGNQIYASLGAIKDPVEQSYLLAFFLENILISEYTECGWDVLPPTLILPIKFMDGQKEKERLKDYLPVNTDEAVIGLHFVKNKNRERIMNFYLVSEEVSYTSSSPNIPLPSNRLNNLAVYTKLDRAYQEAVGFFKATQLEDLDLNTHQVVQHDQMEISEQLKDQEGMAGMIPKVLVARETFINQSGVDYNLWTKETRSVLIQIFSDNMCLY